MSSKQRVVAPAGLVIKRANPHFDHYSPYQAAASYSLAADVSGFTYPQAGCASNSGEMLRLILPPQLHPCKTGIPNGPSHGCDDPITIASLKPGETVLDLGSGGGIDCFLAVRQVGENGKVIGVDMTPDILAKANANEARLGVTNVEFRQGQIEALPVKDNSVDVVMSNCVINLSPDKPAVFREARRVLKPGGRVSINDVVTEGEFSPELRAQTDKWAECVTGAIDVDRYTGMMREAGFADITVVDKVTDPTIERQPGMPRVFAARITAYKR